MRTGAIPPLAEAPLELAPVHDIVWSLSGWETDGQRKSLSSFETVRLVLSDGLFWGDNGWHGSSPPGKSQLPLAF